MTETLDHIIIAVEDLNQATKTMSYYWPEPCMDGA